MKTLYGVLAPAKLNLFLHITGQRIDGYHLLQSVFVPIDWYDILHFELRTDGHIQRIDTNPQVPLPATDLVMRAALALQAATGTHWGANITLEKHIPIQAGMGGGSSNAASCLLALQRLWNVHLPPEKLLEIAQSLGADVPFFLCSSAAWVEGIGEIITPVELPPMQFLVAHPGVGLSTQAVFSSEDLTRDTPITSWAEFTASRENFGRNDLQDVAAQLCPAISSCLQWLADLGLTGRMTGSGSAVFAQVSGASGFNTPNTPKGWAVRLCQTLQKNHGLIQEIGN